MDALAIVLFLAHVFLLAALDLGGQLGLALAVDESLERGVHADPHACTLFVQLMFADIRPHLLGGVRVRHAAHAQHSLKRVVGVHLDLEVVVFPRLLPWRRRRAFARSFFASA